MRHTALQSCVTLVYYIQRWRYHFESGRAGDKFANGANEYYFDRHHA